MSSQIYNKIYYKVKDFVGFNQDLNVYHNIIKGLSPNAMKILLYFIAQATVKRTTPIRVNDLYKQTVYTIDWEGIGIPSSNASRGRLTKELRDNNIALLISKDTYVVSIDIISAFTLSQRKKYKDILNDKPKFMVPTADGLTGDANPSI